MPSVLFSVQTSAKKRNMGKRGDYCEKFLDTNDENATILSCDGCDVAVWGLKAAFRKIRIFLGSVTPISTSFWQDQQFSVKPTQKHNPNAHSGRGEVHLASLAICKTSALV